MRFFIILLKWFRLPGVEPSVRHVYGSSLVKCGHLSGGEHVVLASTEVNASCKFKHNRNLHAQRVTDLNKLLVVRDKGYGCRSG
jgi:hypothetical protein